MAEQTAGQPTPEAAALQEPDYSSLVATDDAGDQAKEAKTEPAQEASVAGDAKADVTKDATKADVAADTVVASDAPEPQQAGTPDKALQKVQQDLSATTRKLDVLLEKVGRGETLTPQEQQQAKVAKRKIEELRDAVAAKQFNAFDHSDLLSATVIENGESVQGLREQVKTLEKTIGDMQADKSFDIVARKYQGIDVRSLWDKCLDEAASIIGADNPGVQRLANTYFHQRADAAAKSVKAKQTPLSDTKTSSPTTPGGAKVTLTPSAVAVPEQKTQEQREMDAYMALAKEE